MKIVNVSKAGWSVNEPADERQHGENAVREAVAKIVRQHPGFKVAGSTVTVFEAGESLSMESLANYFPELSPAVVADSPPPRNPAEVPSWPDTPSSSESDSRSSSGSSAT